jgi:hypothetical protein
MCHVARDSCPRTAKVSRGFTERKRPALFAGAHHASIPAVEFREFNNRAGVTCMQYQVISLVDEAWSGLRINLQTRHRLSFILLQYGSTWDDCVVSGGSCCACAVYSCQTLHTSDLAAISTPTAGVLQAIEVFRCQDLSQQWRF